MTKAATKLRRCVASARIGKGGTEILPPQEWARHQSSYAKPQAPCSLRGLWQLPLAGTPAYRRDNLMVRGASSLFSAQVTCVPAT
jgi:hypothetical protein